MAKQLHVPSKPSQSNPADPNLWINGSAVPVTPQPQIVTVQDAPEPQEQLVRLTFDIPETLHRRIKVQLAQKGIKRMAVELRRILEEKFPTTS